MGKVECGSGPGLGSQSLGPLCIHCGIPPVCVTQNAFSEPICQSQISATEPFILS